MSRIKIKTKTVMTAMQIKKLGVWSRAGLFRFDRTMHQASSEKKTIIPAVK